MGNGIKAAFLALAVLAAAGSAFYFGSGVAAKAKTPASAGISTSAPASLPTKSLSLPLFFEPNQGQTAPQVKFLARGSGYGLFLTSDEAVLTLRPKSSSQLSAPSSQRKNSSVIRMRLDGANSSARVSGASPLPGKSNYFIGNDHSKWRQNIPQFARVEYQAVYPGVDLVYYGNQGQLEYDFRVAPGADPNRITLKFDGASARLDAGDLVLSTDNGDVRFHAPHIYQPAEAAEENSAAAEKTVAGGFRQLADNKIAFTIGAYDHNRELVIDPTLTYSTYLGGSGVEGSVKVAVDSAGLIYVAGQTNSSDFPTNIAEANSPNNPPYQMALTAAGATNIFIAVINPSLVPPLYSCAQQGPYFCTSQLVYATYLGSTGSDSLSGIAVDNTAGIYVAGTTTSTCTLASPPDPNCFPTTGNAFQAAPAVAGTHGFFSKLSNTSLSQTLIYGLTYSTYLAGNGNDQVTGLAIDTGCVSKSCFAYLTGTTTSSNVASDTLGFPANPNGFQTSSNSPGFLQFFASKLNPNGSGQLSMIYSTYFGGSNPQQATAIGGGVAVDQSGSTPNMYITGTTNMLPTGLNGAPGFPLYAAQQACLNQASQTNCNSLGGGTNTDAFVAKISPKPGVLPVYSTYLGGSGNEVGTAIAVDSSSDAYITGSTNSNDWANCVGFQCTLAAGAVNAFVAKLGGGPSNSVYPIVYFTYLGGSGQDIGNDIKVDGQQMVRVVGNTTSSDLPVVNFIQSNPPTSTYSGGTYSGGGDAFVALLATAGGTGKVAGDYVSYLGGSQRDRGTGVAIDNFGGTYVAGDTQSSNFPTVTPFQSALNGSQDAFVSRVGPLSALQVQVPTTSPSPNPVNAGVSAAFTFNIINFGPDNASQVSFTATVPTGAGVTSQQAKVTSGSGSCTTLLPGGTTISCTIQNLQVCSGTCTTGAAVEVDVTPTINQNQQSITVSGAAIANGGQQSTATQTVPVVDFKVSATTSTPVINAGAIALVQVSLCPTNTTLGYSGTITPSQTTAPSMVTATTPTFSPTSVTLAGVACGTTTLSIPTVARPVPVGSLFRSRTFYATWLPIGGLSIIGLGVGAGRKRRRLLMGAALFVIAGTAALQVGCGSSSSATTTTGGTVAGTYVVTVNASTGTSGTHTFPVSIQVN